MLEVTHDPGDALALGRRVAVLRAGRLEQVGPAAELYARPASRTVAAALGLPAINFADGVVIPVDGHPAMQMRQGVTVPLPVVAATAQVGSGMSVCLGVRPEHLMPATADSLVPLGDWSVIRSAPMGRRGWRPWNNKASCGRPGSKMSPRADHCRSPHGSTMCWCSMGQALGFGRR